MARSDQTSKLTSNRITDPIYHGIKWPIISSDMGFRGVRLGLTSKLIEPVTKRPHLKATLFAEFLLFERALLELRHNVGPVLTVAPNQCLDLCHATIVATTTALFYPSPAERLVRRDKPAER
jgi:hypothetical protein